MTTIYTIGYAGLDIEKFIEILLSNGITCLVDVRRWPKSKHKVYNKMNLYILLKRYNIKYVWLGYYLGGFRRGGYEAYMKTENFVNGIKILIKLSSIFNVCIMCKERNVDGCHRRYICRYLEAMNFCIIHINSISQKKLSDFD